MMWCCCAHGAADVPCMVLAFSDSVMLQFSWLTNPHTETDARDSFAEQEEAARLRGEELNFAPVEPHVQNVVLGAVSLTEVRVVLRKPGTLLRRRWRCLGPGFLHSLSPEARR